MAHTATTALYSGLTTKPSSMKPKLNKRRRDRDRQKCLEDQKMNRTYKILKINKTQRADRENLVRPVNRVNPVYFFLR